MLYSFTDIPSRREGESHNEIRQHYDDCNIFLKRHCNNSSNVNFFYSLYSIERREFLLARVACVQCFFWGQQPAWNDLDKIVNVG